MEEKKLIKFYKQNAELNLEKIIEEYNPYIHQIIRNMNYYTLSNEDIEEIVADTFFILWKNRTKLEEDKMLSPYLAGIVKNLVREKRKTHTTRYFH